MSTFTPFPRSEAHTSGPAVDQTARDAAAAAQTTAASAKQDAETRAPQAALDALATEVGRKASTQSITDLATTIAAVQLEADAAQTTGDEAKSAAAAEKVRNDEQDTRADEIQASLTDARDRLAQAHTLAATTKDRVDALAASTALHGDALDTLSAEIESIKTNGAPGNGGTTVEDSVARAGVASNLEAIQRVDADVENLQRDQAATETKAQDAQTRVGAAETKVTDHAGRIGTVEALASETATTTSMLNGRVNTLRNTVGDANGGLVKSVEDVKTVVGGSTSGLVKDVADLKASASSGSAAATGRIKRTYDHDLRQITAVTNFDLVAAAGGATHFRLRLYAGGASGTSPSSSGTSNIFFGGEAGEMVETDWISLADVDRITSLIGMGGAGHKGSDTNRTGNNGGSPTTVDLLKGSTAVDTITALGGLEINNPFHAFALVLSKFSRLCPLPGQGSNSTTARGTYCNAQTGRNRPTSGGGAHLASNSTDATAGNLTPGDGGTIIYDRPDAKHGLKMVLGGAGARSTTTTLAPASDGVNPQPGKTGTAGPGGGGAMTGNGGAGGFPGGGGGATTNVTAPSGKGGNGCLDIEFGK